MLHLQRGFHPHALAAQSLIDLIQPCRLFLIQFSQAGLTVRMKQPDQQLVMLMEPRQRCFRLAAKHSPGPSPRRQEHLADKKPRGIQNLPRRNPQ